MSVTINAKGTSVSTFMVGKGGLQLSQAGEITPPPTNDLVFNLGTDKNVIFDAGVAGPALITTSDDQDLHINPAVGGGQYLILNALRWPTTDGTVGQVVGTNGAGILTFVDQGNLAIPDKEIVFGTGPGTDSSSDLTFNSTSLLMTLGVTGSGKIVSGVGNDLEVRTGINSTYLGLYGGDGASFGADVEVGAGAGTSDFGGNITVYGGAGATSGGSISLTGGAGTTLIGGSITLTSGTGVTGAGPINVTAGDATGTGAAGANITLTGGTSVDSEAGGVTLQGGVSTSNYGGLLYLAGGTGDSGGSVTINGGSTVGSGPAGSVTIAGGFAQSGGSIFAGSAFLSGGVAIDGTVGSPLGGVVTITGGVHDNAAQDASNGDGSAVYINGGYGNYGAAAYDGGSVNIKGGNGDLGGNLNLSAGDSDGATGATVAINGGVAATTGGNIILSTATSTTLSERFRILGNGSWSIGSTGTETGTAGFVLTTNGSSAAPTWQAPVPAAPNYQEFSATASQTVFNTSIPTVAKAGTKAYLQVFVNGIFQQEGATKAFTVTGATQITFNAGLAATDDVVIYGYV
jgi:hypothetical protein